MMKTSARSVNLLLMQQKFTAVNSVPVNLTMARK